MLGVPGLIAVASPLPAAIPSAIGAAGPYVRSGEARFHAAGWTLLGAFPATIIGALFSNAIGGRALLVASGAVLVLIGQRILRPIEDSARVQGSARRKNRWLLVTSSAGVGWFTGILANGGGFLLVPMYLLIFGLRMRQSAGTSLLVIAILAIPTLATHWAPGHVDWGVAFAFGLGEVPASIASGRVAHRIEGPRVRHAFGWFLIVSGIAFVAYRLFAA